MMTQTNKSRVIGRKWLPNGATWNDLFALYSPLAPLIIIGCAAASPSKLVERWQLAKALHIKMWFSSPCLVYSIHFLLPLVHIVID